MKKLTPLYLLGIAGLGSVLAGSALAQQDYNNKYYYWGLGLGQSQSQIEDRFTTDSVLRSSNSPSSFSNERQSAAYKVFGGYQFNKNFALEGGYFNLGKTTYSTSVPGGTLNGQYEIEGVNLDLVGTMPLSPKWTALARIGVQHALTRDGFSGPGFPSTAFNDNSSRVNNMKVGLGVQYEISPSMLVRGEAERFRVRDGVATNGDVNYYSLSLVFPFGRKAPQQVAAAPAYVAPPPPPAPAPVVTPPPPPSPPPAPAPRRVQFSADSLFAFDKAQLGTEGRSALDTFSRELQGVRYSTVTVEGNTDRLGSETYNMKLSQQRADAVKAYLISNGGVDPRKITATGRGESNPVTKPEDCKGNKPTPKLIACLQPDRRVDVEVTGEK